MHEHVYVKMHRPGLYWPIRFLLKFGLPIPVFKSFIRFIAQKREENVFLVNRVVLNPVENESIIECIHALLLLYDFTKLL